MNSKNLARPEKWIIMGIPVLFVIGAIVHFVYNLFGKCPVVGLFAPVNESIWEHSKMVLWPVILWWSIYYCCRGKQYNIDKNRWFGGALVALILALVTMPLLYYFYTGAFGVELLWVDAFILLLALIFGQLLGLHIYRYSKGLNVKLVLIIFVVIILLFMLFTFFSPQLPLFQDGVTGGYGINLYSL
jgi:hypothetical protein